MQLFFIFYIYCISDLVCFTDIGTAFSKDAAASMISSIINATAFLFEYSVAKQKGAEIYETTLPENTITRAEAKKAFYDLREQAAENAVEKIKYS